MDNAAPDELVALASVSAAPNPFLLPGFANPLAALEGRAFHAVAARSAGQLDGYLLLGGERPQDMLLGSARALAHPYSPLGIPILRSGREREAADVLIETLSRRGFRQLLLPQLPLASRAARAFADAAPGTARVAARFRRPVLHAEEGGSLRSLASTKTAKEHRRLWRRLEDLGGRLEIARGVALPPALDTFLTLEASGWKGARGTALANGRARERFARHAIENLSSSGHVEIARLLLGERPIAALVTFRVGQLAVPWKIAHDPALARHSPGLLLMRAATRAWLEDESVSRVDPLCEAPHPMLSRLWRDVEPYGTLVLPLRERGSHALLAARAEGVQTRVRRFGRRFKP